MVATTLQVKNADRAAIENYHVPSKTLMQNAARAVLRVLQNGNLKDKSVCVLVGKGNNAGDGFALADMLNRQAIEVNVVLLCGSDFSQDAAYFYDLCLKNKVKISRNVPDSFDICVDAVFGTGFKGKLPDAVFAVFEKINRMPVWRVAVDLPSGLNGDGSDVSPGTFQAHDTVTFQVQKLCHLLPGSSEFCGKVWVEDIGLPDAALQDSGIRCRLLKNFKLPAKDRAAHKGKNGMLFSAVGSICYQGAATLSLCSSLRSGCGMVCAFIPEDIYVPVASKVTGAILQPCPQNERGGFSEQACSVISEQLKTRQPTAFLVGSGIGVSDDSQKLTDYILSLGFPCVLDGDGLRYFAGPKSNAPLVLTPHMGEFARMSGMSIDKVKAERLDICSAFARENRCVLVLKDCITLISAPDGRQWLLAEPNAGLAKGGSGDVLAGMIASFLAQGFGAEDAACAGVYYHSKAAGIALRELGAYGMLPTDVIHFIPASLM